MHIPSILLGAYAAVGLATFGLLLYGGKGTITKPYVWAFYVIVAAYGGAFWPQTFFVIWAITVFTHELRNRLEEHRQSTFSSMMSAFQSAAGPEDDEPSARQIVTEVLHDITPEPIREVDDSDKLREDYGLTTNGIRKAVMYIEKRTKAPLDINLSEVPASIETVGDLIKLTEEAI